jgi:hypothetical protein
MRTNFANCQNILASRLRITLALLAALPLGSPALPLAAQEKAPTALAQAPQAMPIGAAFLEFASSEEALSETKAKVNALLGAFLSTRDELFLVERAELEKVLSEQGMGISGTVTPSSAASIGQLTGASVLISGKVFSVGDKIYAVAKVMSAETGRVFGETETFLQKDAPDQACMRLAEKIAQTIQRRSAELRAPRSSNQDIVASLRPAVSGKKLPSVSIKITERSIGRASIDPAAETELALIMTQLGFSLIDPTKGAQTPDLEIVGEAFSEFGMQKAGLVSSKGRLEVRAIERASGKVLAVDRETSAAVDLSEEIAGKSALQRAAQEIAKRFIPQLVR